MATLITGLGLVGTSYAQLALKRGEKIVFYDVAPRKAIKSDKSKQRVARITHWDKPAGHRRPLTCAAYFSESVSKHPWGRKTQLLRE